MLDAVPEHRRAPVHEGGDQLIDGRAGEREQRVQKRQADDDIEHGKSRHTVLRREVRGPDSFSLWCEEPRSQYTRIGAGRNRFYRRVLSSTLVPTIAVFASISALVSPGRNRHVHPRQLGVDHLGELFERLRARQIVAVDEKCRRAERSDAVAFGHVGVDGSLAALRRERLREARHVQTHLPRVLHEELALRLAREDFVMKFPELALLERSH